MLLDTVMPPKKRKAEEDDSATLVNIQIKANGTSIVKIDDKFDNFPRYITNLVLKQAKDEFAIGEARSRVAASQPMSYKVRSAQGSMPAFVYVKPRITSNTSPPVLPILPHWSYSSKIGLSRSTWTMQTGKSSML